MNREEMVSRVSAIPGEVWDIIIIGGGATGLGIAVEASTRGYKTLLLEQSDFGKATSSRSTKLIHGGVRYLQQGNISLVYEALRERGFLLQNAPHLVHYLAFAVPGYDWWESPYYGTGLKIYELMAGRKKKTGRSRWISKKQMIHQIPTLEQKGLRGGIVYYDGQFDDARLIINLAQTASEAGAAVINYFKVKSLVKKEGRVIGVIAQDEETKEEYEIFSKAVVNATGIFTDSIRQMDQKGVPDLIRPSQGIHIVLDKSFLPGKTALLVPNTDDRRVLFAIPWKENVLVGTTDTPIERPTLEPKALPEEVSFLLSHISRYLTKKPQAEDILSVFAGIRPLVSPAGRKTTASVSRDYKIDISPSNLISVAGGKWTTYRKMAEETVDRAVSASGLWPVASVTRNMRIHGYCEDSSLFGPLQDYGSDAEILERLLEENAEFSERIHPQSTILRGEVIWAVRQEMARTPEDFLSRRRRTLLLDARLSQKMVPEVARIMAIEMKKEKKWIEEQVRCYLRLSENYLL